MGVKSYQEWKNIQHQCTLAFIVDTVNHNQGIQHASIAPRAVPYLVTIRCAVLISTLVSSRIERSLLILIIIIILIFVISDKDIDIMSMSLY